MNSDKAKTHDEHTGTVGIDNQGMPQQDEQKQPAEAMSMPSTHGPPIASPALDSFQEERLSGPSHQVGSAYAHVLV